jgi:hypothetical protein
MCLTLSENNQKLRTRKFWKRKVYKLATFKLEAEGLYGFYQERHRYEGCQLSDVTPVKTGLDVERGLHSFLNRDSLKQNPFKYFDGDHYCTELTVVMECDLPVGAQYYRNKTRAVSDKLIVRKVYISEVAIAQMTDRQKWQLASEFPLVVMSSKEMKSRFSNY